MAQTKPTKRIQSGRAIQLFNIDDSVLLDHQQQIIDECGGFRALLAAALSNPSFSFQTADSDPLSKYASGWDPNISPFINDMTSALCDLITNNDWFLCKDLPTSTDFASTVAQMIYEYAVTYELVVQLPESTTRETIFSIGVRTEGEAHLSGMKSERMQNIKGIQNGMNIWIDRQYKFKLVETMPALTEINTYFLSNCKSNGIGTAPMIKLVNPSASDIIYLFLEPMRRHRHGGWADKIVHEGWVKRNTIGWYPPANSQDGDYDVWEYAVSRKY